MHDRTWVGVWAWRRRRVASVTSLKSARRMHALATAQNAGQPFHFPFNLDSTVDARALKTIHKWVLRRIDAVESGLAMFPAQVNSPAVRMAVQAVSDEAATLHALAELCASALKQRSEKAAARRARRKATQADEERARQEWVEKEAVRRAAVHEQEEADAVDSVLRHEAREEAAARRKARRKAKRGKKKRKKTSRR